MQKKKLIVWVIPILSAIVFYLYQTNQKSTIKEELKNFSYTDTAKINKIFMADKNGKTVTLIKNDNNAWYVKDKFIADKSKIKNLLRAIYQIQVKSPVSKKARNNIIKRLSSGHVKIEIYANNEMVKSYFVGGPTQDHLGTYMIMQNNETKTMSKEPFIMHIPGFNGYLTPWYFVEHELWRDRTIFKYKASELKTITLLNHRYPQKSYSLNKIDGLKFEMNIGNKNNNNNVIQQLDSLNLARYLAAYRNIPFFAIANKLPKQKNDSILNSTPFFTLMVTDIYNKKTTLKGYYRAAEPGLVDDNGNPAVYDRDNFYCRIDNEPYLCIVQYFVFEKLLRSPDYFLPKIK